MIEKLQSKNKWGDIMSVLNDINSGRAKLQARGFIYKEPTLIAPKHIRGFLTLPCFYPQEPSFTHLDFLLNNELIEKIKTVNSTENAIYLGVDRYECDEFPNVIHETGGVIITDIVINSSEQSIKENQSSVRLGRKGTRLSCEDRGESLEEP